MKQKNINPPLSFLTLGFLGVQICVVMFGFAVPDFFNAYKGFFSLNSTMWLSIAVIGMFVQPLAGLMSDHAWGPYGRRKYFLLLAGSFGAVSMFLMALSRSWSLIIFFFYLSLITLNVMIVMYRSTVVDITVGKRERTKGFVLLAAYQMVAMIIVLLLRDWSQTNIAIRQTEYNLPISVVVITFLGAVLLLITTLSSCSKIKERTPDDVTSSSSFKELKVKTEDEIVRVGKISYQRQGFMWLSVTILMLLVFSTLGFKNEIYILPVLSFIFGIMLIIAHYINRRAKRVGRFMELMTDIMNIPPLMKEVSIIQVVGWFGIFMIFHFLTPVLTRYLQSGYADTLPQLSNPYIYFILLSLIGLLLLPVVFRLANRYDMKMVMGTSLLSAGLAVWLFFLLPNMLTFMLFVVIFALLWVVMVTIPYILISTVIPTNRIGVFMGLFNTFIFAPYTVVPEVGNSILNTTNHSLIYIVSLGAFTMIAAGILSIIGKKL